MFHALQVFTILLSFFLSSIYELKQGSLELHIRSEFFTIFGNVLASWCSWFENSKISWIIGLQNYIT